MILIQEIAPYKMTSYLDVSAETIRKKIILK
ncbi:MAG: hypothetical protein ACJA1Z_002875 [Patiriisocius sp.]|jgi:hypothetical protein